MWISNFASNFVRKLRARDGALVADYTMPFNGSEGMVFDGSNMWVVLYFFNTLVKLRASDGYALATTTVTAGTSPRYIAFDGTNVWMTDTTAASVSRR
jgi:hypothetical protein